MNFVSKMMLGLAAGAALTAATSALALQPATPAPTPAPTPGKAPEASKPAETKPADTKPADNKEQTVMVVMKTSMGEITLELDAAKAPISVENFLKYVDKGYYSGTIFHRVIDGFMIQGGGFDKDMKQKETEKPIKNEWKNGLKNKRGTIAMARTNDPDSATSQFFINVKDNDFLDQARDGAAYCVFGKVVTGMDVVDKIKAVKTTKKGGMGDVPIETVTIESVSRVKGGAAPAKPAEKPADKPADKK